ncbi:LOW QUALITY PROTEIN: hypothetical protein BC937DRAFT_87555 [Endogone sp. FLAS-F59071]|nr:LOW QUALITY PROTEIN: hypothetical protein BC937DRAFT_87555 [Endogone sp. FLAS-F59071]|eukprot:RUS19402.1 LOW QUALITY PROTEIN: hypothetical protein BC937DRAFT_87555 [Endogone sp. FLAS-F59071]
MDRTRTRPSPSTPRISKRVRPVGTTPKHLRNRDVTRYDIDALTEAQNDDEDDEDDDDYLPPLPPPLEIPEGFYSPLRNNDHEWGSRRKILWFTPRDSSNPVTLSYDVDEAEAEASDSVKISENAENGNDVFIVESSDDEICAENLTSEFGEFSLHEDRRLRSPFNSNDAEITTFGVVPNPRQGTSYTTTAKRKDKIQQSLFPAKMSPQPVSIVADGINMSRVEHDFGDDESMSGSDLGGAMVGYSPSTDIVVILSDQEDGINSSSCAHEYHALHMPKGQSDTDEPMYDQEDDYQDRGILTYSPSFEPPNSVLSRAKSSSREPSSTQSRSPLKRRLDNTNTGAAGSKTRENKRKPIPKSQVSGLNQAKKSQPAPKDPVMPDYSTMTLVEATTVSIPWKYPRTVQRYIASIHSISRPTPTQTIAKKYGFRATSRNIMVPQLELVWNTLHPASQPPEPPVAATLKDAGDIVSKSVTTAARKEGKLKRNRDYREIVAEVDEIRSEIVSYQKGVRESNDSNRVLKNSGVDSEDEDGLDEDKDEGRNEDENDDKDDLGDNEGVLLELGHLMPPKDDRSSAVVAPKRSIEERLSEFIRRDREWYERVLRYEPLNIDKLYYDIVTTYTSQMTIPHLSQQNANRKGHCR